MHRAVGLLLLAVLGGSAFEAPAEQPVRPRVRVTLALTGDVDGTVRDPLIAAAERGASEAGLRPGTEGSADYEIDGRVHAEGRLFGIELRLLSGDRRTVLETRTERCEFCTTEELIEATERTAATLRPPTLGAPVRARDVGFWRTSGGIGLLAGGAAAVIGSVLLGIDGRCSGGALGVGGECQFVYTTGSAGWVFLGTGALVALVSALVFGYSVWPWF